MSGNSIIIVSSDGIEAEHPSKYLDMKVQIVTPDCRILNRRIVIDVDESDPHEIRVYREGEDEPMHTIALD